LRQPIRKLLVPKEIVAGRIVTDRARGLFWVGRHVMTLWVREQQRKETFAAQSCESSIRWLHEARARSHPRTMRRGGSTHDRRPIRRAPSSRRNSFGRGSMPSLPDTASVHAARQPPQRLPPVPQAPQCTLTSRSLAACRLPTLRGDCGCHVVSYVVELAAQASIHRHGPVGNRRKSACIGFLSVQSTTDARAFS
jgi:hypothetical protein